MMNQRTYQGERTIDGLLVTVDGAALPLFAEIANYSTATFEWGYEGHEPLQLAFAMLYFTTMDVDLSHRLAPAFMQDIVAALANEWEIPETLIKNFVQEAGSRHDVGRVAG